MQKGLGVVAKDSKNDNQALAPEAIVAEAQRRMQAREALSASFVSGAGATQRGWARRLNRGVFWLTQHWLALFNALAGLYIAGAVSAPFFMYWGWTGGANMLYLFYKPFCHQYPFRSWFVFGERVAYPLPAPISVLQMNQTAHYIGDVAHGYKMALCQRDIAMYGIIFWAGLLYGILRAKKTIRPLPMWLYFVFGVMPIALDGGIQWLSYALWTLFPGVLAYPFETIPLMRALTGALFGVGMVAVSYPLLNEYFEEIRAMLAERFGWERKFFSLPERAT